MQGDKNKFIIYKKNLSKIVRKFRTFNAMKEYHKIYWKIEDLHTLHMCG